MVAFGQFSNCLVRTAELILGSFYVDTTDVDEATAGGLTVFLAAGFLVGIFILGPIFSNCKTRIRKVILLGTLYSIATTAIILLGIISVDTATITHYMSNATKLYLEISLSFVAAAAIGVLYYVVPTLFSATLGENKGLGSAFIDGFAYFCSGFLWAGLGNIVKIPIYGWLYTWLVVAGILATGGSIMTLFLHQHINCIKEFPILD